MGRHKQEIQMIDNFIVSKKGTLFGFGPAELAEHIVAVARAASRDQFSEIVQQERSCVDAAAHLTAGPWST